MFEDPEELDDPEDPKVVLPDKPEPVEFEPDPLEFEPDPDVDPDVFEVESVEFDPDVVVFWRNLRFFLSKSKTSED